MPFTSASSNVSPSISNSVRVVTLYSTAECFVETHITASIEANKVNSHFIPATVPYDVSLGHETNASDNDRFIAVIGSSSSGTLHISERR